MPKLKDPVLPLRMVVCLHILLNIILRATLAPHKAERTSPMHCADIHVRKVGWPKTTGYAGHAGILELRGPFNKTRSASARPSPQHHTQGTPTSTQQGPTRPLRGLLSPPSASQRPSRAAMQASKRPPTCKHTCECYPSCSHALGDLLVTSEISWVVVDA